MNETGSPADGAEHDSWVQVPRLRQRASIPQGQRVGWLELFYDLVYVATIIQLGNALSAHVSVGGALAFASVFVPVWWSWLGMSYYSNRFAIDDLPHRMLVLLQMAGVSAMAVAVPDVMDGGHELFALAYAFARAVLALMYFRAALQVRTARRMAFRFGAGFLVTSTLWAASAWVPAPYCFVVWGVAILLSVIAPVSEASQQLLGDYGYDSGHLSERLGLLTIIVLGESFVKVLGTATEQGMDASTGLLGGFALFVTSTIWWLYFDEISLGVRSGFAWSRAWLYAHLPLTGAITAVGVGLKKVVFVAGDSEVGLGYRMLLCAALSIALLSLAVIEAANASPPGARRTLRVGGRIAVALILMTLATAADRVPPWVFLGAIAGLLGGHLVLDTRQASRDAAAPWTPM